MSAARFVQSLRKEKKARARRTYPDRIGTDLVTEQVKKVLQDTDQKLILMVRG